MKANFPPITVKELKEALSKLKDDATISFLMESGCCGDYEEMTSHDLEVYKDEHIVIRLDSLPGYKSCIQAGGTIEADKKYWEKVNGSNTKESKDEPST